MLTGYSAGDLTKIDEDSSHDRFDQLAEKKDSIVIEPTRFYSTLSFKSFWHYRELLYFLALRDIKIRYKQTALGIAWVVLQPVITTAIFTTIFLQVGSFRDLAVPYPLFAFSGFTLWTFVSAAILNCSNSLINHSSLITKVYFPRLIIPMSAVGATLVDLVFGLVSLFAAMLFYRIVPAWSVVLLPLLLVPTLLISLAIGILAATLNVKYRDVKYILPFAVQILLFVSPVFYALSIIPEQSLWLWKLNPLAGILENFRALLFGLPFDWYSFGVSIILSALLFTIAVYVFHQMEDDFADVI